MFTIMITAILMIATSPLQNAYADLISTSPESIVTATGEKTWPWNNHVHSFTEEHCQFQSCFTHEHFLGDHCHTSDFITLQSSHNTINYVLDVKSLKDYTVDVSSTSGFSSSITLTDADAVATTPLIIGSNTITPNQKGDATIKVTSGIESVLLSTLASTSKPSGGCFSETVTATVSEDVTLTITQPNAGGPKPRLSQESGDNLLGFSTITQLIDIPAKGSELTVTVPGTTTCEVFDQHGATRGSCGTHALGSGDYSGFWSIVADGSTTTFMSASVDSTDLELLTEITK